MILFRSATLALATIIFYGSAVVFAQEQFALSVQLAPSPNNETEQLVSMYDAPAEVQSMHGSNRFGRTNDFGVMLNAMKNRTAWGVEQDEYIAGTAMGSIVIVGFACIWFFVILFLKCLGQKRVGFLSGWFRNNHNAEAADQEAEQRDVDVENGQQNTDDDDDATEKERKFYRRVKSIRIAFFVCGGLLVMSLILFYTKGLMTVKKSLDDIDDVMNWVSITTYKARRPIQWIRARETDLLWEMDLVSSQVQSCSTLTPEGRSIVEIISTLASTVSQATALLENHLEPASDILAFVRTSGRNLQDKVQYGAVGYLAIAFVSSAMLVLVLYMMAKVFVLANWGRRFACRRKGAAENVAQSPKVEKGCCGCEKNSCCLVCLRSASSMLFLSLFVLSLLLSWLVPSVAVIAAIAGADFCMQPDQYVLSLVENFNNDVLYDYISYYISGCVGENLPLQDLIYKIDSMVEDAASTFEVMASVSSEDMSSICGLGNQQVETMMKSLDNAGSIVTEMHDRFDPFRELTECSKVSSMYTTFVHDAVCINGVGGLAWVFRTMLSMAVMAMFMLTFRAAFRPIDVKGDTVDDEVGDARPEETLDVIGAIPLRGNQQEYNMPNGRELSGSTPQRGYQQEYNMPNGRELAGPIPQRGYQQEYNMNMPNGRELSGPIPQRGYQQEYNMNMTNDRELAGPVPQRGYQQEYNMPNGRELVGPIPQRGYQQEYNMPIGRELVGPIPQRTYQQEYNMPIGRELVSPIPQRGYQQEYNMPIGRENNTGVHRGGLRQMIGMLEPFKTDEEIARELIAYARGPYTPISYSPNDYSVHDYSARQKSSQMVKTLLENFPLPAQQDSESGFTVSDTTNTTSVSGDGKALPQKYGESGCKVLDKTNTTSVSGDGKALPLSAQEDGESECKVLEETETTAVSKDGKSLKVTKVTLIQNPDGTITKKTKVRKQKKPKVHVNAGDTSFSPDDYNATVTSFSPDDYNISDISFSPDDYCAPPEPLQIVEAASLPISQQDDDAVVDIVRSEKNTRVRRGSLQKMIGVLKPRKTSDAIPEEIAYSPDDNVEQENPQMIQTVPLPAHHDEEQAAPLQISQQDDDAVGDIVRSEKNTRVLRGSLRKMIGVLKPRKTSDATPDEIAYSPDDDVEQENPQMIPTVPLPAHHDEESECKVLDKTTTTSVSADGKSLVVTTVTLLGNPDSIIS